MTPPSPSNDIGLKRYLLIGGLLLVAVPTGFLSIAFFGSGLFSNPILAGLCGIVSATALAIACIVSLVWQRTRSGIGAVIIGGASGLGALVLFLYAVEALGN
jgi:hypothetical protein